MPATTPDGSYDLQAAFIFVKHGDPPPLDWMAAHPGWIKIPAVMIPRESPHHPANGAPTPNFRKRSENALG
jgi:hypothetical protein